MTKSLIALPLVAAALSGCGSLIVDKKFDENSGNQGISYYLPKRLHKVTLTVARKPVGDEAAIKKAAEAVAAAMAGKASADKALAEAKEATAKAKAVVDTGKPPSEDSLKKLAAATEAERGAEATAAAAGKVVDGALSNYAQLLSAKAEAIGGIPGQPDSDTAQAKDKVAAAVTVKAAASAGKRSAEAHLRQVQAQYDTDPRPPAMKPELGRRVAEAKNALRVAADGEQLANAKLDDALGGYTVAAQGLADGRACIVTLEVEPLPLVPDAGAAHIADLDHLGTRDDQLTLTTTPAGLLSDAEGQAVDRTGDIIVAIAEAAFGASSWVPKINLQSTLTEKAPPPATKPMCSPVKIVQAVNFGDQQSRAEFGDALEAAASGFSIESSEIAAAEGELNKPENKNASCKAGPKECTGLAYRRDLPYHISLKYGDNVISSMVVSLPQLSPVAYVPFDTGLFVTNNYAVTFENGMLVKRELSRPSEALAAAKLPVNMAKGVLSVVTDLVKLRVDYVSQDTKEAAARQANLEAMYALREAIKNAGAGTLVPSAPEE